MRLKPAIIILMAFAVVIAGLAALLVIYREPGPGQGGLVKGGVVFPELKPDEVVRIEFASPKGTMVLERIGSEKWRIVRPFEGPASGEKADRLLGGLLRLQAVNSFVPKSMADYELDQPRFRVSVTTQSHGVFRIAFGTDVAAGGATGDTYVDIYSLAETGGSDRAARHRYASVGDGSRVLVVPDDIVPLINVDLSTFREPALVYRETRDKFERINPADLARVSIKSRADGNGKRTMTFSVTNGRTWRMVEPVEARSDDARVAQAVRGVLDLAAVDGGFVEDNPHDLSKYGLDEPSAEVELELGQAPGDRKAVLAVRFGKSPADNESLVYAQSGARNAVLLVKGDVVRRFLTEPVEFFRDRRLVTLAPQSIESAEFVRVNYPKLKVVRDHGAPNRWRIDEPVVSAAQSEQVEQLLASAVGLTVSAGGFISEDPGDPAKYGLDTPSMTISFVLKTADGKTAPPPVRILIGKPFPDNDRLFYARNTAEPSVVLVAKNALDALSPDVRSLRSRRLFEEFRSGDASEIVIERGGSTLKLEKNKQLQWTSAEPKELSVDSAAVAEFLEAVGRVAVEAWPADRPLDYAIFGLDKPYATLAVKFGPQKGEAGGPVTKRIICFGRRTPGDGGCYVWVPPEPNVYEIKADLLARIESGELAFRSRQVLSFDPARVKMVHIEGGRAEYRIQRPAGGQWMLSAPIPALADIASVLGLLDTLRGLTARQLVSAGGPADPQYGLDKPYRKVTLIIEQDGTLVSRTLLVGAPVKGQEDADRYAALAEDRLVFTMPGSVVNSIDAEFLSTTVVNVMKAEINRITVEHRDGSVVQAVRTASGWQITSRRDVAADQDKIEALAEEAGWVRAESFAALNQENLERYGLARPLLTVTIGRPARLPIVLQIGDRAEPLAPLPPGKRKTTLYYATGGDLPAVCLLDEDKVKALNKRVEDLIKKGGP